MIVCQSDGFCVVGIGIQQMTLIARLDHFVVNGQLGEYYRRHHIVFYQRAGSKGQESITAAEINFSIREANASLRSKF